MYVVANTAGRDHLPMMINNISQRYKEHLQSLPKENKLGDLVRRTVFHALGVDRTNKITDALLSTKQDDVSKRAGQYLLQQNTGTEKTVIAAHVAQDIISKLFTSAPLPSFDPIEGVELPAPRKKVKEFEQKLKAMLSPEKTTARAKKGDYSKAALEALQELYPEVYDELILWGTKKLQSRSLTRQQRRALRTMLGIRSQEDLKYQHVFSQPDTETGGIAGRKPGGVQAERMINANKTPSQIME